MRICNFLTAVMFASACIAAARSVRKLHRLDILVIVSLTARRCRHRANSVVVPDAACRCLAFRVRTVAMQCTAGGSTDRVSVKSWARSLAQMCFRVHVRVRTRVRNGSARPGPSFWADSGLISGPTRAGPPLVWAKFRPFLPIFMIKFCS